MPGFLRNAALMATVALAVAPGTVSVLSDSSAIADAGVTFSNAHISDTGKVAVIIFGRVHGGAPVITSVTVGGVAVTHKHSKLDTGTAGNAWVWAGTATGVPTGSAQSVVYDPGGATTGNIIIFVVDLPSDATGATGGVGSSRLTSANTQITATSSALQGTGKLMLGVAGTINGGCDPFSASGWTKVTDADNGPNDGSDAAAALFYKVGGTAGGTESLVATSGTSDDNWAALVMEIMS